ncbi:MAG: hypothetical protein LBC38_02230, partial [Oscillospiraceae bacterium]|nr:hypothetical protein [Oscillospiraceae bacterium]
ICENFTKENSKMSTDKKTWKPGDETDSDLDLYVVDGSGNHLGEISVSKGQRVPPTRIENAQGYIEK